jgi:1-acyl-sn-glycerol-3-phosphate acyltransferase
VILSKNFYLFQKLFSESLESVTEIDFIFVNHITTVDFLFMVSYLQALKIENFNFVLRKGVIFNPVVGLTMYANSDIKLNRKWEMDSVVQYENVILFVKRRV